MLNAAFTPFFPDLFLPGGFADHVPGCRAAVAKGAPWRLGDHILLGGGEREPLSEQAVRGFYEALPFRNSSTLPACLHMRQLICTPGL